MRVNHRILLQWAVIFATFSVLVLRGLDRRNLQDYRRFHSREMQDTLRNERSTPRSFVLPATPEVALVEEERRRAQANTSSAIALRCLANLAERGYLLGGEPSPDDAQTIEALYQFQLTEGIARTGRLDKVTMGFLKCS